MTTETVSGQVHELAVASPLLRIRDLRTSFRRGRDWTEVLHGVSFDVQQHEVLAVVGESGSGKSVTAFSIMRLFDAARTRVSGEIVLNGQNLVSLPEASMRSLRGNEIAMIFQEPMTSLNPVLTVGTQLAETLRQHRGMGRPEALAESVRLMDRVRIPQAATRLNSYPHHFSGGMRQRVMIAMALACRPKLLIADEPTTALDVTIQAQIIDLIQELQREDGMSVLFISHDMGVVAEIADRTVVMNRGEVVETGSTAVIFAQPQRPYTRALLGAVPRLGALAGTALPRRFDPVDPTSGVAVAAPAFPETRDAAATPVLELRGLTTRFDIGGGMGRARGRVHAVEQVSFAIGRGETLSLVGESGSGKSTTGRSLLGITPPTAGEVLLDGVRVNPDSRQGQAALRRALQMIFQDPYASLNPRIRVGDAIADAAVLSRRLDRSVARREALAMLDRVGLDPAMSERFPHEFSGGQRQRICIARTLMARPRLIVVDEGVSALDVTVKAQIVNLLLDLQEEQGLSYLFISHDMAVVERVSHRVAVMYLGEIVEIGPRASVLGNPQHDYTKRLLSAVPVPDPALRGTRRALPNDHLGTVIRPMDYLAPRRDYDLVGPDHHVMRQPPAH